MFSTFTNQDFVREASLRGGCLKSYEVGHKVYFCLQTGPALIQVEPGEELPVPCPETLDSNHKQSLVYFGSHNLTDSVRLHNPTITQYGTYRDINTHIRAIEH